MDPPGLEGWRRAHRELLAAAERIERDASRPRPAGVVRWARLAEGVGRLEAALPRHLAAEERALSPLIERFLTEGTGLRETLGRGQEALRELVALLRRSLDAVLRGRSEAEMDLLAAARDLPLLLREHARTLDRAVLPLLDRLRRRSRGGRLRTDPSEG